MFTVKRVRELLRAVQAGRDGVLPGKNGWEVVVAVRTRDRVGVECDSIGVRTRQEIVGVAPAAWADVLCRKLSYLSEPLRVCERAEEEVLVRSWPLGPADEGRAFFELRVRGGTDVLELKRFVVERETGRRVATAMLFTYDILTRVVNDLLDTVSVPANVLQAAGGGKA